MWIYARNYIFCIDCNRLWHLQSGLVLSPNHLFAIPSSKFNSVSNLLLLSLAFLFRCILYKYEFLLHGENEMWWYTLLEAVAWSWRHSAQFSVAYFTNIIFLLLHWMFHMLYTSPGRGQNKVSRAQDLQGKRRKTRSSHTIISISALNTYNNANFSFSRVRSFQ